MEGVFLLVVPFIYKTEPSCEEWLFLFIKESNFRKYCLFNDQFSRL